MTKPYVAARADDADADTDDADAASDDDAGRCEDIIVLAKKHSVPCSLRRHNSPCGDTWWSMRKHSNPCE